MSARVSYLLWSAAKILADSRCPACSSTSRLIKRKFAVTRLHECNRCRLRFRVPKDTAEINQSFYQENYQQGFTTELPSDDRLEALKQSGFAGHEKDYRRYIDVLQRYPIRSIFDFGCSWGYGSYQLAQAGYEVYAYEISRPRARFAAERLGVNITDSPARVDCFFSAHVMEHLPDPNVIWQKARTVLKPGGLFVAFMPNGDSARESRPEYHRWWGKVHPLMITGDHLRFMGKKHGFDISVYTTPFAEPDEMSGWELLAIGKRSKTAARLEFAQFPMAGVTARRSNA